MGRCTRSARTAGSTYSRPSPSSSCWATASWARTCSPPRPSPTGGCTSAGPTTCSASGTNNAGWAGTGRCSLVVFGDELLDYLAGNGEVDVRPVDAGHGDADHVPLDVHDRAARVAVVHATLHLDLPHLSGGGILAQAGDGRFADGNLTTQALAERVAEHEHLLQQRQPRFLWHGQPVGNSLARTHVEEKWSDQGEVVFPVVRDHFAAVMVLVVPFPAVEDELDGLRPAVL